MKKFFTVLLALALCTTVYAKETVSGKISNKVKKEVSEKKQAAAIKNKIRQHNKILKKRQKYQEILDINQKHLEAKKEELNQWKNKPTENNTQKQVQEENK